MVPDAPPTTVDGAIPKVLGTAGVTVTFAEPVEPLYVAVTVAEVDVLTPVVVVEKVADVPPEPIVTVAGT